MTFLRKNIKLELMRNQLIEIVKQQALRLIQIK